MAIYEYECKDCDARFETDPETFKDLGEDVVVCPECGSIETTKLSIVTGRAARSVPYCPPSPTGGVPR